MYMHKVTSAIRLRAVVGCTLISSISLFVMVQDSDSVVVVLVQNLRGGYGVDHAVAPTIVQIVVMDGNASW